MKNNSGISVMIFASIFLMVLVGCTSQPSEGAIQTAIAETNAVLATSTPLPPTATPTLTLTPTPTITQTPTQTPSPTPDIRIIDRDPIEFQLAKGDLPLEGKYFIPNGYWAGPNTNEEIIAGWTVLEGKAYIQDTGRISGYTTSYARGNLSAKMPEDVDCNVIKFQTTEGAQKAVLIYTRAGRNPDEEWKSPDIELNLGDTVSIEYLKEMTSGGVNRILYFTKFSYRNFVVDCYGWGWESDVPHQFMEDVARKMLNKLKMAELVYPPTITPTITEVP